MKKLLIVIILIAIGGAIYWYGSRSGWFVSNSPDNLPTAEEIERIDAVEEAASQIDPNAKAGAGVVPKGSTPVPPEPVIENDTTPEDTANQE